MGRLVLVPTPIGNLGDITLRALEVLKQADLILAEDTRTSGKLLKHYAIDTPMRAYHMHNEHKISESLVRELSGEVTYALITDAGTPGISDPGFLLARAATEAGVEVECLPGATAMIPAVVAAGLPNDRFTFEGFLPVKKGRQTRLKELAEEPRTMVFYESPHKIVKTLGDLSDVFGSARRATLVREISKLYETYHRGTLGELHAEFEANKAKGELVLVVEGKR
ncbi:16S rRNA (cytidine(1402)-2'-O)-methyltransferase [Cryomorphaceae bacterium]|nr:16S rRNA (cytidine(1402)-2'-O)-methyltransferase [Cryomorphaceae bacterium]